MLIYRARLSEHPMLSADTNSRGDNVVR